MIMSTDNMSWIPPLSLQEREWLNRQRRKRWQKLVKWTDLSDKTLWDWLQLLAVLAVPVAIAIGTMWFSAQQGQANSQASDKQHQTDIQIAQNQQQENALQTYLNQMSDLLLNYKLHESKQGD